MSEDEMTLEDQIRECFARTVYSHKTHEKKAESCANTLRRFKIAQIVFAALTSSGIMALIFTDDLWLKLATAIISLISLCVTGYMKGFDPGATAQKHRDAAADLWAIREAYLSLLTDLKSSAIPDVKARETRDRLMGELAAVYKGAPGTDAKSYAKAQAALQKLDDYTFNSGEIDKFLPPSLKRAD